MTATLTALFTLDAIGANLVLPTDTLTEHDAVTFGALDLPDTSVWRFGTYATVHGSMVQLLATLSLLVPVVWWIERRIGWGATAIWSMLSSFATSLGYASVWILQHGGTGAEQVMYGATGISYGFVSLYVYDSLTRRDWFQSSKRWWKIAWAVSFVGMHSVLYWIPDHALDSQTFVSGIVFGIVPLLLYASNRAWHGWECLLLTLAFLWACVFFVGAPLLIWAL